MERDFGVSIEEKAKALKRSYTLLTLISKLNFQGGIQKFKWQGTTFKMDELISGLSLIARTRFRDLEDMGCRDMAWDITLELDNEKGI